MFHKLKHKLYNFRQKRNTIIQFSPIRSGSTLVYNVLREIFPRKKIVKCHNYRKEVSQYATVVTYRHPFDCIASSIQRYGLMPTDKVVEEQSREFGRNGIWDIVKIKNNSNVLMLKYEDFFNDFDLLYNELECFFCTRISYNKRQEVDNKYNINEVSKTISKFNSFSEYDSLTHLHGKHISQYKGQPNYYKVFFTQDQINYLESVYQEVLVELNYT